MFQTLQCPCGGTFELQKNPTGLWVCDRPDCKRKLTREHIVDLLRYWGRDDLGAMVEYLTGSSVIPWVPDEILAAWAANYEGATTAENPTTATDWLNARFATEDLLRQLAGPDAV